MLAQIGSKVSYLIIFIAVCLTASSAFAQNCSLKLDQLPQPPELRGFRLGMTLEQVRARVPQIQFGKPDSLGIIKTTINPSFDPRFDKASFADVRTISLDFLDGKLVTLWLGYENTFKWPDLEEFIAGMSSILNLPIDWAVKRNGRQLSCAGFSVFASIIGGGPGLRLTDETAQDEIGNRREAAEAAREAQAVGDKSNKLYYPSDCTALDAVPVSNRVTFKDRDEAEKAGYRRAKDCQEE